VKLSNGNPDCAEKRGWDRSRDRGVGR